MPTAEELEKIERQRYEESMETPENFTKWYTDLYLAAIDSKTALKLPYSASFTLPYGWIKWLHSDKYDNSKIEEFSEFINNVFQLEHDKTYFIKTGLFSNKFDFKTCKLDDIKNVGRQFLYIYYKSMSVGADMTNEIVIREYIEPKQELKTIYNGMPLRTEYRVFVDLKGEDSEVIDVVNYWHPEVMKGNFSKEDEEAYNSSKDEMTSRFNKNVDFVKDEILKVAKRVKSDTLTGKWSIDVMQNGDNREEDFYIIDCARMSRSALVEFVNADE